MATIELNHQPDFDADKLYALLQARLGDRYVVTQAPRRQTRRQIAFHGEQWVVVVRRNAWCGAFVLVEQLPERTRIRLWSDAPSEAVFRTFILVPLLLPLLIVVLPVIKIGSRPVLRDVRAALAELRSS